MSVVLFRNIKLTSAQLAAIQQLRANASSSSAGSIVQQGSIVLDNTKPPPALSAERVRTHPKIGNREIVGYGLKGKPEYFDLVMFPCPSIRWEADTPQIAALRNKEKADWKQLTVDEKKKRSFCRERKTSNHLPLFQSLVYRASFRQTFEEFTAPTGQWKSAIGWLLISLSGLVLAYDVWRRVCTLTRKSAETLFIDITRRCFLLCFRLHFRSSGQFERR